MRSWRRVCAGPGGQATDRRSGYSCWARGRDLCGSLQSVSLTATLTIIMTAGLTLASRHIAAAAQLCNIISSPGVC